MFALVLFMGGVVTVCRWIGVLSVVVFRLIAWGLYGCWMVLVVTTRLVTAALNQRARDRERL